MKYVAVDQNGVMYPLFSNAPRTELMQRFCYKSANRIMRRENGVEKHIGYEIGDKFLTLFRCEEI